MGGAPRTRGLSIGCQKPRQVHGMPGNIIRNPANSACNIPRYGGYHARIDKYRRAIEAIRALEGSNDAQHALAADRL
jgi:hypothetical protein